MNQERFLNRTLKGIAVSSGICIGKVYLLERGKIHVTKHSIKEEQVAKEIAKFKAAIKSAVDELNNIKQSIPDDEIRKHAFIIDAHLLILQDRYFYDDIIDTIRRQRINAEWALDLVVSKFLSSFEKVEDPYLRERGQDLNHILQRLLRIMVKGKVSGIDDVKALKGKAVIVAHDLSPADTIQLNLSKVSGFVTDVGGRTSHTSIVARALEIPAVVGLGSITGLVKNNDTIVIDGEEGVVIINPSKEMQKEYLTRQAHLTAQRKEFLRIAKLKSETKDGFKIKVGANIELLVEMDIVERYGAEGIGLYRTEYIYLSRKTLPTEMDHYHIYRKLAENRAIKYTTIRTLDLGGDKFASKIEVPKEINPAMGLRAIRLCIKEVDLFKAQLRGILRASTFGPLRILFPMVSGMEEVKNAKAILRECMEELRAEKVEFNEEIEIGIMIEVPSTTMITDLLAQEVDFFSIGTNDLIQYTLAIDRINEYVSYLYEPLHPAVLRMIKKTVDDAHSRKIAVSLCGEMAGEPLYVPILLGLDLDELSMNAYIIPRVKKIIRGLSHSYCRDLVKEILTKDSAKESEYLLRKEMASLFPDDFPMNPRL
ncbi:MAG: Phosphoenolpyruvate-protein phosphotransferase [Syntrophorhabdaceae bacterium PtaU1.Bin034]|nr:MAG: Phosphoenolpyruvate-protein phosphotransferase [Syntrophorhabdaceae bacterium PtaU1.Bin034]